MDLVWERTLGDRGVVFSFPFAVVLCNDLAGTRGNFTLLPIQHVIHTPSEAVRRMNTIQIAVYFDLVATRVQIVKVAKMNVVIEK